MCLFLTAREGFVVVDWGYGWGEVLCFVFSLQGVVRCAVGRVRGLLCVCFFFVGRGLWAEGFGDGCAAGGGGG